MAVLLTVVSLPTYVVRLSVAGIPLTMLEVMILLCIIVWLWREKILTRLNFSLRPGQDNPVPKDLRSPIALILVTSFVAIFIAGQTSAAWGIWKAYFLEAITFFLLVLYLFRWPKDIKLLIIALGVLVVSLLPLALTQWLSGWGIPEAWQAASGRRITSVFGYPNAISLLVAPIVAFYLGQLSRRVSRSWFVWSLIVIISGLSIIFWAQTTGALIALGITALYLLWRRKELRPAIIMLLVAVMMTISFWSDWRQNWQMTINRVQRQELNLNSSSLEVRINQWQETSALLADRPFWGSGLSGYQQGLTPYHKNQWLEIFLYPHSLFLNFWVELGLLGLLAFCWLFVRIIQRLWDKKNQVVDSTLLWGLRAAWLTWFIHGLVDVPYFKNDLSILFWLLLFLTIKVSQSHQTVKKSEAIA